MIITLTTDFGLADPFVGIMKGVILGIAPDSQLIDITHDIRSYDITEGALVLNSAYRYFPAGTIHVVVVDPGVGSARSPMAALSRGHMFVAPDNGVLSFVLSSDPMAAIYRITNESLFNENVSRTFHGRDIFAPVAANLARGTPIDSVGPRVLDFVQKPFPTPRPQGDKLVGTILRVDKFGNIITNFSRQQLGPDSSLRVAGLSINRFCATFSEADPGEFFAFEGSTGFIEIALNQGSAADKLKVGRGAEIELETTSANQ